MALLYNMNELYLLQLEYRSNIRISKNDLLDIAINNDDHIILASINYM